ncbi:MAG: CRISPR-associated endonuclease Cas1 [Bacteroidetes bacterium]|nr:MAG: CRISPR-associated endonuclease Cas1 [Bacteroidota bacterium]
MNLVLNSYGVTLQKENDLFVVSTTDGKQSFAPDKVKSISISKAAKITSDAVLLAIRHQVDVVFVNDGGMPEGRIWSVKYGSISDIRRSQLEFFYSPAAMLWVKQLLVEKLNNQVALLLAVGPTDATQLPAYNLVRFAINSIEDHKKKIERCEGETLSDMAPSLRGWEGAAGRKYFATISALLPPAYQFENRNRQPATDMFNSMLNYAYGILYGKVEGALIKAGIDPYAGIFHRDEYNRPALVFDVIERYRLWMDYVVVQLCMQAAIPPDCFATDAQTGACRLEALGKRILIQAVNDYLAEIIPIEGTERSRLTHIDLQQQQLARFFTTAAG